MDYTQTIKINKGKYNKYEILDYYNSFTEIIKRTNVSNIIISIDVTLPDSQSYSFSDINEFKNHIIAKDELIFSRLLILGASLNEKYSIQLFTDIDTTTLMFSSYSKNWVDEEIYKYKLFLDGKAYENQSSLSNKKIIYTEPILDNKKLDIESTTSKTEPISDIKDLKKSKLDLSNKINIFGIGVAIIIAILTWTVFKN